MARIRTIKPDFWTDERLTECSLSARLLFIGTWNFADDQGNLPRSAKKLKMQVLPADNIDCEPLVVELLTQGLLIEYSVSGEKYLHIKNFDRHQVINRPSKSTIPDISLSDDSVSTHEELTDGREGKGREGNKEAKASMSESSDSDESEPVVSKEKRNGIPYQAIVDLYHKHLPTCPNVEVITSTRKGQISARWKSGELDTIESWGEFFDYCAKSKFLIGASDPTPGRKKFVADLEWLTKESNYAKIVEGKYHG